MPYNSSFKDKIVYSNVNFQKILTFYLFNCPVLGISVRAKTFSDYGWEGSSKFSKLKSQLLKAASNDLSSQYYPCEKAELPPPNSRCGTD